MLEVAHLPALANAYLAGADPRLPYASPLYGDAAGLPPTLIQVGSDEILRDDLVRMAEKLRAAGCDVEIEVWPRMPHAWHLYARIIPEGRWRSSESASSCSGGSSSCLARTGSDLGSVAIVGVEAPFQSAGLSRTISTPAAGDVDGAAGFPGILDRSNDGNDVAPPKATLRSTTEVADMMTIYNFARAHAANA